MSACVPSGLVNSNVAFIKSPDILESKDSQEITTLALAGLINTGVNEESGDALISIYDFKSYTEQGAQAAPIMKQFIQVSKIKNNEIVTFSVPNQMALKAGRYIVVIQTSKETVRGNIISVKR